MKASAGLSTATRHPTRGRPARPRPERFRLIGPSQRLDPRTHAFRADVADIALASLLFAPHYARAEARGCASGAVMVRAGPSHDAPAVSQLIHGEGFALLDEAGGWGWGRCLHDDYVGYVPADALGAPGEATHRVTAPLTLVFSHADIKAPVTARRAIGARLAGRPVGDFLHTGEGFVPLRHVAPIDAVAGDPVAVAERLIGAPYLWGGRGAGGIDCSGLVQVALGQAGITAPRDSDMQRDALGAAIAPDVPLRRGDLVFFPGHVGLMVDAARIIHANAFWMAVTVEPLADVVARLASTHAEPISARRRIAA